MTDDKTREEFEERRYIPDVVFWDFELDRYSSNCSFGVYDADRCNAEFSKWKAAKELYAPREKELERRNAELHKMLREITETARQHSEWMLQSVVERSQAIIAKEIATKEPQ